MIHINIIKASLFALFILTLGALATASQVHAACQLVDPVNGPINITCRKAWLSVSSNGVRSLPSPSSVPVGTRVNIKWVKPFSGNTIVQSWDNATQVASFWQKKNRVWSNNPDNAYMQENGKRPYAVIESKIMPNGQRGWAVIKLQHLKIWNGGN